MRFFNKKIIILFFVSIFINSAFLYIYRKNIFCSGLLRSHGEIAYNLYKYNSIKINYQRMGAINALEEKNKQRADYYEIDHEKYGPPTEYRNYFDSIGYGVLIGLLWKITGSLNFFDIQFLQMLLFSFLLFFFFQIAFMLFDKRTALFSTIALLAFFPIFYLNAQVLNAIWPYYSAVILSYVSLKYLIQKSSWKIPFLGGTLVALFQFMRPPEFAIILSLSTVLIISSFFTKKFKKTFSLLFILFITNIFFFWIPFSTYNKIAYDRYFVGPTGINLIEGLGEFPNKWGYKLCDGWYGDFMRKNYPELKTNLEKDDKARELFFKAIKQDPFFYLQSIFKRIPRLILPGLPSFNYQDKKELYLMYTKGTPISEIIKLVFREPIIIIDFAARHIYIGLFLLLAYLGMLLAFIRKKYFALFFIFFGIIASSYKVIFFHTDHRYLIPYFAFFAIFVGYFLANIHTARPE